MKNGSPANLGDVDVGAFRSGDDHHLEVVELGQGPLGGGTGLVSSVVQDSIDLRRGTRIKGFSERKRQTSHHECGAKFKKVVTTLCSFMKTSHL